MHRKLFERHLGAAFDLDARETEGDFVKTGTLTPKAGGPPVEIRGFIPRFYDEGYVESFGMQWSTFRNVQHDSRNGYGHSRDRLVKGTKWPIQNLKGLTLLECGSGPGRFTEIFAASGAEVVTVDMSRAVDVNLENCGRRDNVMFLQSDITDMPFFHGRFDLVFCYGVLQHTPNPGATFRSLTRYLKPGGRISVDIYRKMFVPAWYYHPKYLWRPLATRMDKRKVLRALEWYIPKYIDFDTALKSIPKVGSYLAGLIPIPCWNYIDMGYTREERIRHAVMDTFDALTPAYDIPKSRSEVQAWFRTLPELADVEVFHGINGVIANARRKAG